jgi:hypothetical protein
MKHRKPRAKAIRPALAGLALMAILAAFLAAPALAAEGDTGGSLRFEKTVPFDVGRRLDLGAQVGPVRVSSVQFENLGRGGGGGGSIVGRLRGAAGGPSDTQTTLRASFDSENPRDEEWVVTYTIELLDKKGKLIDRGSRNESFEGEADTVKLDHPILDYVVPMIDRVRVKLEARLD